MKKLQPLCWAAKPCLGCWVRYSARDLFQTLSTTRNKYKLCEYYEIGISNNNGSKANKLLDSDRKRLKSRP